MKYFNELLENYSKHHTKGFTKLTHFIGVPAIILSLQIVFSWVSFTVFSYDISLAWILLTVLFAYYLFLNLTLGLITGIALTIITIIASLISKNTFNEFSLIMALVLFIGGWILQLIGHQHEGNKPAFLQNILQIFVAPLFLALEIKTLLK